MRLAQLEAPVEDEIRHFGRGEFRDEICRDAGDVVVVATEPAVIARMENVYGVVASDCTSTNVVDNCCTEKQLINI